MTKLTITRVPTVNMLVLRQEDGRDFFISTKDSIIISPSSLAFILKFMLDNDFLSPKVLEGVLVEHNTMKENL